MQFDLLLVILEGGSEHFFGAAMATITQTDGSLPEPIPGYRLVKKIGKGGFGEVWEAIGPGNISVAMKMIPRFGAISSSEMRGLEIIKSIRHANLLSLFGIWETLDYFYIASELADGSLLDSLKSHQQAGGKGIPAPLLREYMHDAARGIDFLNNYRLPDQTVGGIQHRDIKPHNLLLMNGTVKVADYGLVRFLNRETGNHSGSMTPHYAAPEFFRGKTYKQSDQYSLGITYYHLRTGNLPFSGDHAAIMAGHLQGEPNLTKISPEERLLVIRALAKDPADRWPSCQDFVKELSQFLENNTVDSLSNEFFSCHQSTNENFVENTPAVFSKFNNHSSPENLINSSANLPRAPRVKVNARFFGCSLEIMLACLILVAGYALFSVYHNFNKVKAPAVNAVNDGVEMKEDAALDLK